MWHLSGHNFEAKKWRGIDVGGILKKNEKNVGFSLKFIKVLSFLNINFQIIPLVYALKKVQRHLSNKGLLSIHHQKNLTKQGF